MLSRITLCLAALVPVWLIGIIHLPHPFDGDQALFMVGARCLEAGGTLYVDFWDNKQPGIYLFYWLAGRVFGFHEVGVHLLELIWYSLLAVGMVLGLRSYFQRPWLAACVPFATIGVFYGMADKWHLTQVESLVCLPLFGCLYFTWDIASDRERHVLRWFLSGVCAGLLVTFKLALAPLPMAAWLVAVVSSLRADGWKCGPLLFRGLVGAFFGGLLSLAVVAAGFAWHGSLKELYWTSFIYPSEALGASTPASLSRLAGSVAWLVAHSFSVLIFALMGVIASHGRRWRLMVAPLLASLVVGCGIIYIQSWSWWQYHFCLLLMPLGILAVCGIDAILSDGPWLGRVPTDVLAGVLLTFCLIGPSVPEMGVKTLAFAQELQRHTSWSHEYQRAIDPDERLAWDSTQFLRDESSDAPIYAFGNPIYLYLSGRRQAIPEHGWSPEAMLPSQWKALPGKLDKARPAWLFISTDTTGLIDERSPEARQVIERLYEPRHTNEAGIWFVLKEPSSPSR